MDPIGPGLIRGSGDDAPLFRIATYNDRLSSIRGMITLLNGYIKGVTVCMHYFTNIMYHLPRLLSACFLPFIVFHFLVPGEKKVKGEMESPRHESVGEIGTRACWRKRNAFALSVKW